jgi:predicted amidohydrolase YtcJ
MLEQAMKEGNYSLEYMRSLRTTLEHNFLLGNVPDVIEGLKKFGVILNVKLRHLAEAPPLIKDYGERLRSFAMPVKTWINHGIRLTLESEGSDSWTPIYSLVTRKMPKSYFIDSTPDPDAPEWEILPEEAIDRVTALKMATTWASEYILAEDTLGTLEAGKFADFAVLDRDFFTIPADEIRDVEVVMTGLNGKVVFDRDQLAGGN